MKSFMILVGIAEPSLHPDQEGEDPEDITLIPDFVNLRYELGCTL